MQGSLLIIIIGIQSISLILPQFIPASIFTQTYQIWKKIERFLISLGRSH